MERLNLVYNMDYLKTDLDDYEIRKLIVNNKKRLGIISFNDYRTPLSYFIVIDGITMDDEQYRLTISIRDKTIHRELEIAACGSGLKDRLKAELLHRADILFSMDASLKARDVLTTMIENAET